MYNFDEIIQRQGTNSVKYEASKMLYPILPDDFIPMWVADMDFACPQVVLDAMKNRLDQRILGYSIIVDPAYYEALGKWMKERHHWEVDPRTSLFASGVITALRKSVEYLTKKTEGVILHTPAYHPFDDVIQEYGRNTVYSRLIKENGSYSIDWEDFERKCQDKKNTLFFLCNPHNPTGRVWTKEELIRLGELCFVNDVFVVSDEIHFDFMRKGVEHTVFASLFPNEKRIITCTAPSKTFNLAGNELSNIFVADSQILQYWKLKHLLGHPTPLSIEACKAAYLYGASWVDALNQYLDENFQVLEERIEKELPNISFKIPESTYLAWLDMSGCGFTNRELKLRLSHGGIHVQYEGEFVENDEAHIRMNIACPRSVLNSALDKMVEILGKDAKPPTKFIEVGEILPDAMVDTNQAQATTFSEIAEGKKTVFLFLRYVGCTICRLDLYHLSKRYHEIEAIGGKVVVVLQSSLENIIAENLPFPTVSDPTGKLYEQYGVLPAASTMQILEGNGIEKAMESAKLGMEHGEYEGNELQLPATIVVDEKMVVTYVHYGNGAGDIPSVEEMLSHKDLYFTKC
ncbi:MAG: PatB family C-S lyase [Eubacteriales bacterium]